jgi:hypothetical protein
MKPMATKKKAKPTKKKKKSRALSDNELDNVSGGVGSPTKSVVGVGGTTSVVGVGGTAASKLDKSFKAGIPNKLSSAKLTKIKK